jgi:hypothetical protein
MLETLTVEQRLSKLEAEVEGLKRQAATSGTKDWHAVVGTFKNDPEFAEILRLGREIRLADRPLEDEQD